MNIWWIAGLAIYVLIERVMATGLAVGRVPCSSSGGSGSSIQPSESKTTASFESAKSVRGFYVSLGQHRT